MCPDVIFRALFRRRMMSQGVMRTLGHGLPEHLASDDEGATGLQAPRSWTVASAKRSIDPRLADTMLRLALRGLATRAASDILATPWTRSGGNGGLRTLS